MGELLPKVASKREPGISIHATAFFLLKKKLGASLGPAFALDWQHENRVPFHENLNEIKIRPESLVCPYSTQTTNNREPENLKLQSVFVPDLEQLQRESLPLEQQAGKDLFNLYDYNEYVPTSDDFKEYVRQVEDAAQKNKGGTGIASPMGSNSSPWAKYPRKKRDLSMGVAGMCCKWGCTKMEISTLC
ncbi:relaxin 3 precursor [Alligator mississippiensis]|uniref:Relaxin 3 n=1 Tax=Alligator mississippiensis TaxID=8496 RepID=A0A151M8K5_ALLMI|nr:relaxin 3 precursor [Alligator mississippiensis]